ncbi:MAG TPA: universal stress protein, partial [Anaerolineales bacterium]|nr:universal stress protein [Anaerolineales bacterium]
MTSSEDIVAAVVSRPWPSHTFAHVLTAIEYAAVPEKIWQDADGQFEPVKRTMLKRATEQTGQVADQLEKSGISTEAVIKIDEPRFVILREADEWPADLVLIRAHTYSNFSRWLLGSVSGAVLRDAPCSVEIVRTSPTSAELAAKNGLKILIGIDGSAFSLWAARSVAARPWPSGTIVKLLSVEEPAIHL